MDTKHSDTVRDSYSQRAASYDDANGGWHITLGQDFVSWLDPRPGETAIDLACGTGLVTLPLAKRLGPRGKVVAVDLTPEMVQVGRDRLKSMQDSGDAHGLAPVTWLIGDIASHNMLSEPVVQEILSVDGGFDIISVCSALVLLPDQPKVIQFWIEKLLKTGGRIILDVPTEELTLPFLMTYHLPAAVGLSDDLSKGRLWVKDERSLATTLEEAGLVVEQNIATKSYLATTWYDSDPETGLKVLEQMASKYSNITRDGKMHEARRVWPGIWQTAARPRDDGSMGVEDAHRLYVCVGRKS